MATKKINKPLHGYCDNKECKIAGHLITNYEESSICIECGKEICIVKQEELNKGVKIFDCTCENPNCADLFNHRIRHAVKPEKGNAILIPCNTCSRPLVITDELSVLHKPIDNEEQISLPQGTKEITTEYEINVGDFNIEKILKHSVDEFIKTREEFTENHLRNRINKAIENLRPTVVTIAGSSKKIELKGRLHASFEECLFLANTEKQVFIAGPAGSGKTTLVSQVAEAMGLQFAHISCSAGLSEAHLLGRMLFDGTYVGSDLVRLYEEGGVFLFDEIDAADANTLLIVNSALANGVLSVPNRKENNHAKRHKDFICFCAGNTWGSGSFEYHGRNHLDAAFLDRFSVSKVMIDYDTELEKEICGEYKELHKELSRIRQNIYTNKLRRILSTRAFVSGTKQLNAGMKLKQVIKRFFIGWSDEEVKKADMKIEEPIALAQ